MKKFICGAAPLFLLLTGCSTICSRCPQGQGTQEPVAVVADVQTTGGYVRDPSAEFYRESRAGAAVRMKEASHVLWDCHYIADANAKIRDDGAAKKAAVKSAKKQIAAVGKSTRKGVKRADRSVYARDKSVYAKDKSIYAKKPSAGNDEVAKIAQELSSTEIYFDPASRSMVRKLKPAKELNKDTKSSVVEGVSKAPCNSRLSCRIED